MKTKTVASFLAILAATFLGLNATGQTVQNPGFETSGGTTTGAANWNGAGSGGAIATPYYVQASDAHAGANCLVVEGQGNGVGAGPIVSQDGVTPVVAGTLTLSFYAKASIMNGGGNAQYQISWRNAADAQIGVSGFASFPSALNTSTYTLETISGLTAPANADHCTILLLIAVGAGSGDHWKVQLDDVSLVQNTIATPSTAINYPTNNAPTPTDAPSSVLSMYNSSGTYTDHSGIGWYAGWSGVSSMGDYTITNTSRIVKSYLGLSYAGVEFYNPNQINASAYNTLHVDVWTTANQLAIKLVSTGNGAAPEVIIPASSGTITSNHWVSLDIPLSSFKALAPTLDLTNLDQMLWVDNGDISGPGIQNGSFYIDNVYFYATATATSPTIVIPAVVGGNFTVQSASQTGFNYILQATPTLSPATWTGVQTNAGTGGTLNFSVPTSGNPQRFFRIKVQ